MKTKHLFFTVFSLLVMGCCCCCDDQGGKDGKEAKTCPEGAVKKAVDRKAA